MQEKAVTCTFTGHRENKLPWRGNEDAPECLALKARIADAVQAVYSSGVRHFICGMATGCDMYFCEAVLELRACHEDITLEAAIPWEGQAAGWSEALRARHSRLIEDCDFYTLVQTRYTPDCLIKRNRYMVDSSGVIIAAYSGQPGGTMSTLLYALRQGLEIIELPIS